MKKNFFLFLAGALCLIFSQAGCQKKDGAIVSIKTLEDFGAFAKYELTLNYTNEPAPGEERIAFGEKSPKRGWILSHMVTEASSPRYGKLEVIWLKGQEFDFTFGNRLITDERIYINPTDSKYAYEPKDPAEGGIRLRAQLGEKESCLKKSIDDELIVHVENVSTNEHLIYLNPFSLLTYNYQRLFIWAPPTENTGWVKEIEIVEDYPCYYAKIIWPEETPYPFTFCVLDEEGSETCAGAENSKFLYDGHLTLFFTDFNQ